MVIKTSVIPFLLSLILTCNIGCEKSETYPFDCSELTYKDDFLYQNQFKIDGFYFREGEGFFSVNYFFMNGTNFPYADELFNPNEEKCVKINEEEREIPYGWGYFIVEDDILKVQTYDPGSLNRYDEYKVMEKWARIENDSTLYFYKKISPEGTTSNLNLRYHFKSCLNKPDSTNILMDCK